ncbi:MAG: metallopeptidase TldD-related protein [Acidobacteriota bacterium]
MKFLYKVLLLSTLCLTVSSMFAAKKAGSPVLAVMKDELHRSLDKLREQPVPPYFLSYEITETHSFNVSSSFGVLRQNTENRRRMLGIGVRVGDYTLDNTHPIRGRARMGFRDRFSRMEAPIEDDSDALRVTLWYHTNRKYKRAIEQLTQVKTNVKVKVEEEDASADFSREPSERYVEGIVSVHVDQDLWQKKIKKYSSPFARYGNIYGGDAWLSVIGETRWYVSSEGSEIQTSRKYYRLMISAFTKAEDGMELPRYESFFSFTPEGLPEDERVLQTVEKMIADLQALRTAPVVEPYTGPAILSGRASGVFFHEVFGHRIEGHRQKREEEGQTFKKKVNRQVLPDTFSVHFDPTLPQVGSTDLAGHYQFDNEGVRARRLTVIDKGVLKSFLMSRSPIEGFSQSNGHGRSQPGFAPVARQSNLLVDISNPVSRDQLKNLLIEKLKAQNKPFGLFFEDIQGGFTMTGRSIPNVFNVLPIMVYRIHADGREELVRGVDLIGTPLTAFSQIAAGDDQIEVFNGVCGAESGGVPVSAASPAVFVSQIEVQKKAKSQERPPILSPPFSEESYSHGL